VVAEMPAKDDRMGRVFSMTNQEGEKYEFDGAT
jgi:hypothetical protein